METVLKKIGQDLASVSTTDLMGAQTNFRKLVAMSQDYTTQQVKAKSATQQWTESLVRQDIHIGQLRKSGKMFNDVLREQYQLQKMTAVQWTKNASGMISADIIVPKGTNKAITELTGSLSHNIKVLAEGKAAGKDYADAVDVMRMRLGMANQVLGSVADNMVKWGKNTQWAGRQLTVGLAVPLAAFGALTASIANKVNEQMTRIIKVYDFTTQGAAQAAESQQLQVESMQMATEVAHLYGKAMEETLSVEADLAATGLKGAELIRSTAEVQRAATLGEMDYQNTIKATIALQSIYGASWAKTGGIAKNTADAFNYMNSIENATSLSMQDFVEAIPRAAGPLHELGGTVQDLGILLTAMKTAGVDATVGANALKSSLGSLINPSKQATKLIGDLTHNTVHLGEIVQRNGGDYVKTMTEFSSGLEKAFAGMSDQDRNLNIQRIVEALFGKQQYARIGGIIQQLALVHDQTTQIGRAYAVNEAGVTSWANTASGELQKVRQSASGQFKIAVQSIRAQFEPVGEQFLSYGAKFLGWITKLVQMFNKLPGAMKSGLLITAIFAAAAGPLIMFLGLIANLIGQGMKMAHWVLNLGDAFKAMTAEERAAEMLGEQHAIAWKNQANAAQALAGSIKMLTNNLNDLAAQQKLANIANGVIAPGAAPVAPIKYSASSPTGFRQQGRIVSYDAVAGMTPIVPHPSMPGRYLQGNKFASQAAFDAYNAAMAKASVTTAQVGRNWSAIGGHMQKLAIGVGLMGSMVSHGNQLFGTIMNVVFAAGLIGPTIVKGLKAAGVATMFSRLFTGLGGASVIAPLRQGLMSMIPIIARLAGPLALLGSAAAFIAIKIHGAMADARKRQDEINQSAKTWGDILGFAYSEVAKIKQANGDQKSSVDELRIAYEKANKESAKMLQNLKAQGDEQAVVNAAIQEGVKVMQHGGSSTQARQAVQVSLAVAGYDQGEVDNLMKKFVDQINFDDAKQVLQKKIDGFATDFKDMLTNAVEKTGFWEGMWRGLSGNDGLNSAAKEAAKNAAKDFWNSWNQTGSAQDKLAFSQQFADMLNQQEDQIFNGLGKTMTDKFRELGINNMRALYLAMRDRNNMSIEDFSAKYGPNAEKLGETILSLNSTQTKSINDAGQAEEQFAQNLARANGMSEDQVKHIHTIDGAFAQLNHGIISTTDAQAQWEQQIRESKDAYDSMTDAQKLDMLNTYRRMAGLADATSVQQGFNDAVNAGTDAIKANTAAAADNIQITKDNISDLTKNAMTGAQSSVLSQADSIWNEWAQAQVDAIKTTTKDLDAQAKKEQDRVKHQIKISDQYYDGRIKKLQKQLEAEKKADEQRQKMFDAEMTRLQRLAEMANNNIDFNVALNSGNLDEAAKIRNTMQATQDTNTLNDANANATDAAKAREDALQAQIDALKNAKDARHTDLQNHLDALKAKNDAAKQARDQDTQNQKAALQKQLTQRKTYLDMEIAAIKANVPRTKKEYDDQIAQIEAAYKKYGLDLQSYGSQWGQFVGTALSDNVTAAANSMKNDINWQNIASTIGDQFAQGAFGISLNEWANWINTGKAPKNLKPGGTTDAQWEKQHPGSKSTAPKRMLGLHGGGPVSDDSRHNLLGRNPNSPLHHDEQMVRAQKGEYVISKHAAAKLGTDYLDALNAGRTLPPNIGGMDLGPSGLAMTNLTAMLMSTMAGTMKMASDQQSSSGSADAIVAAAAGDYAGQSFTADQLANAAKIIAVGKSMGASQRDLIVGIMTALQESTLRNLPGGDRDSVGLFQQRPSQGWGTIDDLMNPAYSSRKFFESLLSIKNRDKMALTEEAQAVQRSASPDAYAKWEDTARAIISGTLSAGAAGGGGRGWLKPLTAYTLSSGYGMRVNPITGKRALHNGVDLAAPMGTPIHAVGSGDVIFAGPASGYGNWTVIDHGGGIKSAYGHQSRLLVHSGQPVMRGQVIGNVGSTGNSTGPHLHFMMAQGSGIMPYGEWTDPRMYIPSLNIGGTVKYDNTIANLHKNEKVLTAPLSADLERGIKNLDGGSGDQYTITVDLRGALVRDDVDIEAAVTKAIAKIESKKGRSRRINN